MRPRGFKGRAYEAALWKYQEHFGEEYPIDFMFYIFSECLVVMDIEWRIRKNRPVKREEYSPVFLREAPRHLTLEEDLKELEEELKDRPEEELQAFIAAAKRDFQDRQRREEEEALWKARWEERRAKSDNLDWKKWDPVRNAILWEYKNAFGKEYPRKKRKARTEVIVRDIYNAIRYAKVKTQEEKMGLRFFLMFETFTMCRHSKVFNFVMGKGKKIRGMIENMIGDNEDSPPQLEIKDSSGKSSFLDLQKITKINGCKVPEPEDYEETGTLGE